MPACHGNVLDTAQCQPDLTRRDAGGQRLIARDVAELDDHRVAHEHTPEGAELVVDGPGELAEFQETSFRRRESADGEVGVELGD